MSGSLDLYGLALAIGVLALLGWYFWHVGSSFVVTGRRIASFLDGRAARERAALEREAIAGPTPLWLKAVRFILIASLFALLAALFWIKTTAN